MTKTTYIPNYLDEKQATSIYNRLVKLPWREGIRSKNGFTRLAYPVLDYNTFDKEVMRIVETAITAYFGGGILAGIYLNYYKDGTHYTPNHSHIGTSQIIISLGATRTLTIGKYNYPMRNGDMAFFGSTIHGVPKELDVKDGRISIAVFVKKV